MLSAMVYTALKLYHIRLIRPVFEHAGLNCYTLLSPSITFLHCFTLSSKLTFSENLILHLSHVSVCRTDLMAL